ncbi:MAG: hypothetical protein KL787_07530 [Taibaiella sp.]|nr:hypothetical protein [Taibaiella sp.]
MKSIGRKDETIRKILIQDINTDLEKARDLAIDFDKFVFVSTFRDDAQIQEYLNQIKKEQETTISFILLGMGYHNKNILNNQRLYYISIFQSL